MTTVGWLQVTGQTATIQDVVDRLRRYSVRQAMGIVGRITLALTEEVAGAGAKANREIHFHIGERLLGTEGATALIDIVRSRQRADDAADDFAIFHERQALNALKLAFLVVDVDAPEPEGVNLVHFVEALLMLNDLIDPSEGSMGPGTPGGQDAMELYVSANTLFNESSPLMRDFVRAHYLYVEQHPELGVPGAVDVPVALGRATGMDADTAWLALYALYAFWAGRKGADLDAGRIVVDRHQYFATLPGLSDAERARWFELAMWEAKDLQERIRSKYSLADPRYWDVLPFEERPLVAFGDVIFCTSLPLLRRLPGGALQHRLQDPKVFDSKETQLFRITRGQLVERYTSETLARAFGERFIPETELMKHAAGAKVCDGIIVYPDALILVESKASSPLLDTRHATNYARFRNDWGATMRRAADQFGSTLALIRSGAFAPLGIAPTTLWEIFPVVAVFEQAVQPLLYRSIRDKDLAGHPLSARIASGEVRPLQLLHVKEVEMWESAAEQGVSVLDLLRRKTSTVESTELSFHHFIYINGETFQDHHTHWMASRFEAITDSALQGLRALGLSQDCVANDEDM